MPSLGVAERAVLLRVARRAIARRLGIPSGLDDPDPSAVGSAVMVEPAAVFVTLKLDGLRGCIGTLEASMPLLRAVEYHAERAAFDDPRFPPLDAAELDRVTIHVSVLSPPRPIASPSEIRIGRDGVILERGSARAVFLPQVAVEQRWSLDQLLEQLARKAGLAPDGFRDARLHAFEAEAFAEGGGDQDAGG